jgi:hypothetical protein
MHSSDPSTLEASSQRTRPRVSTRNLAAAVMVSGVGGIGIQAAAPAIAEAAIYTPFAQGICAAPGWTGAWTRSPYKVKGAISAQSRCTGPSSPGPGWDRAWIRNNRTSSLLASTGTRHGYADTGYIYPGHAQVRTYTKVTTDNAYYHNTYAGSYRSP